MPNLTRGATRPSSTRSRLLLVRQPVRSVRRHHEHDRTPMRLAIGVLVAFGTVAAVWLMGSLGYRLGFAPIMHVPEMAGGAGTGLAIGTLVVIAFPRLVFEAGLARPMWLMLGFALIAMPAAGLGAARPPVPGGPRPKSSVTAIASAGGVIAMISACLLIWWTGSPERRGLLRAMPLDPLAAPAWHDDLQTVAGLDVLALICAALWVVLVLRLPIALWLRAIAASATFFTLVVMFVGTAISATTATQVGTGRSLCALGDDGGTPRIILGSTAHHMATVVVNGDRAVVELRNHPDAIAVHGRDSIVGYLERWSGE
jgi:hypothetical protein